MFLMLTLKELKQIFKSVTFYLFAFIVVLFYLTQYGESAPVNAKKPVQPLSEMQFMYTKMLEDYNDGKLTNKKLAEMLGLLASRPDAPEEVTRSFDKANGYVLNDKEKEALKNTLEKMNPGGIDKKENIFKIKFRTSNKEYLSIMKELDSSLGGYTYYYDENAKGVLLGEENGYGATNITSPVDQMKATYHSMRNALISGSILKYKLHFATNVHLSEEQKNLIQNDLNRIFPNGILDDKNPLFLVSYDECLKIVKNLDEQLGTDIFENTLKGEHIYRPMTYEEAMTEYNKLLGKDKITNAYARILADYMGVIAGFLPIFLAGFILTRDYRSRMHELIYSREVSSIIYVLSKFTAVAAAITLCYLGVAAHATIVFSQLAAEYGNQIDIFAFVKYILAWVVPTVLFTTSFGLFTSILFRSGIPSIVLLVVMWFSSAMPLFGDYGIFKYFIRFNVVASAEEYEKYQNAIIVNRISFILISFIMVAAASIVLSWRRSAGHGTISGYIKNRTV